MKESLLIIRWQSPTLLLYNLFSLTLLIWWFSSATLCFENPLPFICVLKKWWEKEKIDMWFLFYHPTPPPSGGWDNQVPPTWWTITWLEIGFDWNFLVYFVPDQMASLAHMIGGSSFMTVFCFSAAIIHNVSLFFFFQFSIIKIFCCCLAECLKKIMSEWSIAMHHLDHLKKPKTLFLMGMNPSMTSLLML